MPEGVYYICLIVNVIELCSDLFRTMTSRSTRCSVRLFSNPEDLELTSDFPIPNPVVELLLGVPAKATLTMTMMMICTVKLYVDG